MFAPELHHCECGSRMRFPAEWRRTEQRWWVRMVCPECWEATEGTYDRRAIERLDGELDAGCRALLADLRRLEYANMSEEVEVFVSALAADALLPEDF